MSTEFEGSLQVDPQGRLLISPELAARLGIAPGQRLRYHLHGGELRIDLPPDALAQVYLEPTNACNLECTTCMRNVWDEPLGQMQPETFERFLDGVRARPTTPKVFFGGIGEPLVHPEIVEMVGQARRAGCQVELITNGVMLDDKRAEGLIAAGLDRLWISIDGASPESYADVRLGAELPGVLEHISGLVALREKSFLSRPVIGIAFVAMRRNIADLPEVLKIAARLGAERVSVTNVLAHTSDLRQEVLYDQSLYADLNPGGKLVVDIPRIDFTIEGQPILDNILNDPRYCIHLAGERLNQPLNRCPFIARGSISIRWDGAVSPCLPLLHTHTSYLDNHQRKSNAVILGNINRQSLEEIWSGDEYRTLRRRLQSFDFSPCVICNSCEYANQNLEDCFGNTAPACGGCLWAQGLIQCP